MKKVFFSDKKRCPDLKSIIKKMPKNSLVIFREYSLENAAREKLAAEIFAICKEKNIKFLVGKNLELARKLRADGVHFSDKDKLPLQILNRKNLPKNFIFSFACHNFLSVLKCKKLKADMVFISPIFATKSHESAKNIGLMHFSKMLLLSKMKIFALGGVNKQNLKSLQKLGVKGFGAIEIFL